MNDRKCNTADEKKELIFEILVSHIRLLWIAYLLFIITYYFSVLGSKGSLFCFMVSAGTYLMLVSIQLCGVSLLKKLRKSRKN